MGMSGTWLVWVFFGLAFVVANLPWLSDRIFFVIEPKQGEKKAAMRLLEWFVLYLIVGLIALGFERQVTGGNHPQEWEFYAVTLSLFTVFALPGFIYRYDLLKLLQRR
jgi:hypothetical protein